MSDKIKKFLKKLQSRELESVLALLYDIRNNDLSHLDIKPLKGQKNIYRVRKGSIRVIFYKDNKDIKIFSISRRDDKTYRDF